MKINPINIDNIPQRNMAGNGKYEELYRQLLELPSGKGLCVRPDDNEDLKSIAACLRDRLKRRSCPENHRDFIVAVREDVLYLGRK